MVWNNLAALFAYITSTTTSSTNFGVLICVVGFLDPSANDPICYINIFPNSNLNGCPSANPSLLAGICSSCGLNIIKGGCVSNLFVYSLVACRPLCVYYYCCDHFDVDVIVATNDVNVVDFQWCPSNLHIRPHPFANAPHPLKTLCNVPS
jgi:hypothetical protein